MGFQVPLLAQMDKLRVYETRKRSLLKAVSFRVIEVVVDTLILSFFVTVPIAIGLAVVLEFICFLLHFLFERVWNKIDYGRVIKKKCDM
jgi:uncharacterized membrane protein